MHNIREMIETGSIKNDFNKLTTAAKKFENNLYKALDDSQFQIIEVAPEGFAALGYRISIEKNLKIIKNNRGYGVPYIEIKFSIPHKECTNKRQTIEGEHLLSIYIHRDSTVYRFEDERLEYFCETGSHELLWPIEKLLCERLLTSNAITDVSPG